ncbi:MAG TPA: hypothetical protein DIC35_04105 [Candidatus Moranbacteria bacterium]|nr:hypothetical protein [Candidatus Moranbacteria bacterium]
MEIVGLFFLNIINKNKNKKMKRNFAKKISAINVLALLIAAVAPFVSFNETKAANLATAYVKLDRLRASTETGGTICARPTTASTEASVQITFPAGFVLNATAANWTTSTTNLPSGTSAWAGIGTATAVSGQVVTFPSGELAVGTTYCFNFSETSTLTNGAAGNDQLGTISTRDGALSTIDSANYALSIVSDDQIVVSAVVPPIFSFALDGNADSFTGNLSSSSVTSTSGRTASIATNANNGWVTWVKSANSGLNSASISAAINTAGSLDDAPTDVSGTTGYVLDVDVTTDSAQGVGVVSQAAGYGAEYNGVGANSGGTLSSTFQAIAASNGTTGGDVLTLTERARVTAVQPAANDYTDTLTVIAAGRF